MANTERTRQLQAAIAHAIRTGGGVFRFHYVCEDGETFSAIAPSEGGAFRVLNAERPGVRAEPDGATHCPRETRAARLGLGGGQ